MNAAPSPAKVKFLTDFLARSIAVLNHPLIARVHLAEITRLEGEEIVASAGGCARILLTALSDMASAPCTMAELYRLGRIATEAHALVQDQLERLLRDQVPA